MVIINDVLDYSKIEAKRLELHPEPFELERTVQDVIMLLQPSAREKGIALMLDYDLFLPAQVVGDPGRLRQVLTNLIGNAVKFTSEGHVLVRVTGMVDETNGVLSLHIAVEDTGIGVPNDMIDHIFGDFNQVETEQNRKFEGTGLGLSICKQLVEIMEGEIWVRSEENKGSCFGMRVDLGVVGESGGNLWAPLQGLEVATVIVASPVSRGVLERQLSQLGIAVKTAATLTEARNSINGEPDLLVVDQRAMSQLMSDVSKPMHTNPPMLLLQNAADGKSPQELGKTQGTLNTPPSRQELLSALAKISFVPNTKPPAPARQMRILVAEDNGTNQLVLRKMLKSLNIEIQCVSDGEQALAAYEQNPPDLIFMDISMPRMDGKQATIAIRDLEKLTGKHVPIVALTAHAPENDGQKIMKCGLDHYLTKPLDKAALVQQIEAAFVEGMQPLTPAQVDG